MKYINLISDKIDYLFKRGKNADERCFDYFLRTITFFVILLAVLFYGSFVIADESYTTIGDAGLITEVFTSEGLNTALSNSNKTTSDFVSVGIASGLSSYPFSLDDLKNLKIPSSITYNGNTYSPEDYFIFLARGNVSDHGINYLTCYVIVGEDLVIGNAGYTVYNFQSSGIGIFAAAVNPNNLNQLWDGNPVYTQMTQGINSDTNGFDSSITYQYYSIPTPIYYASNEFYGLLLDESVNSNVRSDFTYQYYHYPDNLFQLNYLYEQLHYVPDPVESDENNLYLDEVQIGLTSVNNNQDLLSSEVVVGVSTSDDYILNHLDNFELNIDFKFHIKDTFVSSPNDPNTDYYISYPLRAFLNDPVSVSIIEIMRNSTFPSGSTYSNFYQYYTDLLNQNNYHVVSEGTFRGIIPVITQTFYDTLFGNFHIVNPSLPNYTIFDFNLEVTCWLTSVNTPEESGNYSKKFDFLNGSESVTSAGLLQNYNPWEGTQEPTANPLIPSGGQNPAYGYGGGGTTVNNITVSGQKVPINANTKAEVQEVLDTYTDVTDHFKNLWGELAEENNENNFLQMINGTLPQVTGMDYIMKCACVIFGLAVILFVLKVLLF